MKRRLTELTPYLLVLGMDFYLLPLLARDTGTAMLLMLCVMPLIALLTGAAYGVCRGFSVWLPAAALLLFLPTVFIHYNSSAWVYAPSYAAVVLLGNGIGKAFHGRR